MADRILLDKLEFYITNVCNLTCSGCNRYNNYHFRGWYDWNDYKENLEKWVDYIDIKHPVVLGGEPLLNPTVLQWVKGLNRLWPNHTGVQIQTNGTRINKVDGLYELIRKDKNWIGISVHSEDDMDDIFALIKEFLKPPVIKTSKKNNSVGSDFQFIDANHRQIHVWLNTKFVQSNIVESDNGKFTLYQSDPAKAHENCTFRKFKNYHWIGGKIYKCGPVALMPMFDKQYHFEISDQDRSLLHNGQGLAVEDFDHSGIDFFKNIDNVIPQCKFCPETYDSKIITFSTTKKSWKISNNKSSTELTNGV